MTIIALFPGEGVGKLKNAAIAREIAAQLQSVNKPLRCESSALPKQHEPAFFRDDAGGAVAGAFGGAGLARRTAAGVVKLPA